MSLAQQIITKIESIPPLSQSAMKILKLMDDDERSLMDIARIVELDPALTVNVLKVVNSPAYGVGQEVSSLDRALSLLGEKIIAGIAIATCSPEVYDSALDGYDADRGALWMHCLHTAIFAREIAVHAKVELNPQDAFTAGILHDIGKAVISSFFKGKAALLLYAVDAHKVNDFTEAESTLLGQNHCDVGGLLAQHWNLPDKLAQCIIYHHTPSLADERWRSLVFAVHLGDALAMMQGSDTGADSLQYLLDDTWEQYFTLTEQTLDEIVASAYEEFTHTKMILQQ